MIGQQRPTGSEVDATLPVRATPWYINGRAEATGPGGFARFHHEVATRLATDENAWIISPAPGQAGPLRGRYWERRTLPGLSADGVLLSTANNGPVRHRRHAVVVHDLLPLTHPHTVSPLYARVQRLQLPRLCRTAAAVITVSQYVADQLVEYLGVDRERISIATPGVSAAFRDCAQPDDKPRFGIGANETLITALVSSIPRKNSSQTLEALAKVAAHNPHVRLIVAGHDGPRRVFGRSTVRPTHPKVQDLGPIDDNALAALLRATDVFVSLSTGEGFGLPPMEALACGTAVVSTSVPSVVELGCDTVRIAADPGAAADEVLDLIRLQQDRDARDALREAGRAAVASLTWDRTARAVADVLRRLESNDH